MVEEVVLVSGDDELRSLKKFGLAVIIDSRQTSPHRTTTTSCARYDTCVSTSHSIVLTLRGREFLKLGNCLHPSHKQNKYQRLASPRHRHRQRHQTRSDHGLNISSSIDVNVNVDTDIVNTITKKHHEIQPPQPAPPLRHPRSRSQATLLQTRTSALRPGDQSIRGMCRQPDSNSHVGMSGSAASDELVYGCACEAGGGGPGEGGVVCDA